MARVEEKMVKENSDFKLGEIIPQAQYASCSKGNTFALAVRRYVYQDVIRLSDAQKLINCSLVQPYTTNSAKVVFLNERPMSRPFRGSGNFCIQCDRSLQDPFLFCSISCKVNYIDTAKPGGKRLDPSQELLPFFYKTRPDVSFLELEEDPQMTPCNGGSAMSC
ncbi:hypothetical protein V6N13_133820 [Hibiscus sabdariffa]